MVVDNSNDLIAGVDYNPAQEVVVVPGDESDPYWNSSCNGCTDSSANNYDATATEDDGSCTYPAPMANLFFSEYAETGNPAFEPSASKIINPLAADSDSIT